MSKTFTSRPAVTQGRGRGRGTTASTQTNTRTTQGTSTSSGATARPKMYGAGTTTGLGRGVGRGMATRQNAAFGLNEEEDSLDRPPAQVPQEQRMTYQGNYTKISPNEKKRHEIQQMAQQEEMAYRAYKQANTPSTVNYVGTAGGGELKESEVRKKSQQEMSKYHRLERKQQLVANKKTVEQVEIDRRKAEQRKKTEQNEIRKKQEEENEAHRWDEQRRRTNEAFLRRLENQSKKIPQTTANISPAEKKNPVTAGSDAIGGEKKGHRYQPGKVPLREIRPARTEEKDSDSDVERLGHSSIITETACSQQRASDITSPLGASAAIASPLRTTGGHTDEFQKKVIALQAIFPQYPETELREILLQLNGSLDEAVAVLND